MMKKALMAVAALCFIGMAFADLTIPPDQPVCRLYGMIQVFGTICGIVAVSYAGLMLATTHDLTERNNAKLLISGVVIGLMVIWLAPLIVQNLVGSSSVCGW